MLSYEMARYMGRCGIKEAESKPRQKRESENSRFRTKFLCLLVYGRKFGELAQQRIRVTQTIGFSKQIHGSGKQKPEADVYGF
jgi:hypothetical protein